MRSAILMAVLAATGCLRSTQFQCDNDTACGTQGICESTGFCSFADSECTSGRRYADSAGPNASQCTSGGNTGSDGSIDSPLTDARPIDGTVSVGCPSGYNTVAGAGTHLYKILTTLAHWDQQQAQCQATTLSANLFVPADLAEQTALDAVAGVATYWVGVHQTNANNVWLALPGDTTPTISPLPWAAGQPVLTGPIKDCALATSATHEWSNDRCLNTNLAAICECVP